MNETVTVSGVSAEAATSTMTALEERRNERIAKEDAQDEIAPRGAGAL